MKIQVKQFFHAAHKLPDTEFLISKGCANLHGHTYLADIDIIGANTRRGMVIDFKAIKDIVNRLDHHYINEVWEGIVDWSGVPPTAENIALFLKESIETSFPDLTVSISLAEGYKGEVGTSWVTV